MSLCLAINYGGRTEIADAAKKIAEDVRAGRSTPKVWTRRRSPGYLSTAGCPTPTS